MRYLGVHERLLDPYPDGVSNSSYSFHTIVAGVRTTEDAALANAIKNRGLRNWSWSLDEHGYQGLDTGDSGTGDLAIGEMDPP